MQITVWALVDTSGEVCATARRPSDERAAALRSKGCRIYEIWVELPDDLDVDARIRTEGVRKT